MTKSIIISADDYAQSSAIDNAIIHLILQQQISAASCLVLSPRWNEASKLLTSQIRSQADIGLHLDFTLYGDAYSHPLLIARSLLHTLSTKKIKHCINQQLDIFESRLGTPPDYIDGHQHVHQLPQIREVLIDTVGHRYANLSCLPWIRLAKPPKATGFKSAVIRALGAEAMEKIARKSGFIVSGDLLGVYDFSNYEKSYKERLNAWISEVRRGGMTSVLMCHPAIADDESAKNDSIYSARLNEFSVLSNFNFNLNGLKLDRKPFNASTF